MTIKYKLVSMGLMVAFFISCTSSKQASSSGDDLGGMQHVMLDTMEVSPDENGTSPEVLPAYKATDERTWDLLHTSLDLSFDWAKEMVNGKALLTLTPLFYSQKSIHLDAVNFDIRRIIIDDHQIDNYQNTGTEIVITLPGVYQKDQQLIIEIEYAAHPSASAGSTDRAITSDKGLYFIDPQDTIPGLPMQIWTQGETNSNSRWFPTIDQPNERGTQEIKLTVADTMMTLSNGLLISSTPLPGGMRRDHWKLDLPHAPYLAMVAIGRWDKVTDYWRGRPLDYYVDPGYGPSARAIFANTPEMIDFFSKKLGYDFVWPKYSQIIVKNFVTGAMENTTAVVFNDIVQFHQDEIIDEGSNDYIVAHELVHHWFGDLVTCESWSNIVLNEGFANYAEYLWQEYKYDRERADLSRMNELSGYFDQAAHDTHPLIHYHYTNEDALFDAHSYNKGGLVLHMLRDEVGDEAFFASLQLYLRQHAFKATEIDDLRQAFEEVTGRDLHWFFNQWYFDKGHPVLDISHSFDHSQKKLNIEVKQTQDKEGFRDVFILPIEIAFFHQDSTVEIQHVLLDKGEQTFSFHMASAPLAVVIDPRDILLAVVHHDVPESEYPIRVISDRLSINHRLSAFRLMEDIDPSVLDHLIKDTSYTMKLMVISYLAQKEEIEKLYALSLEETRPELLYYILQSLTERDILKAEEIALRVLKTTDKIPMIYASLKAITIADIDEAMRQLAPFKNNPSPAIYAVQASIFAQKGTIESLDYFTTPKASGIPDGYLEEVIGAMALYMSGKPSSVQDEGLRIINSDFFLKTPDPQYRRFYLITGLLMQYVKERDSAYKGKILDTINSLYDKETNEYLRGILKEGLGQLLD